MNENLHILDQIFDWKRYWYPENIQLEFPYGDFLPNPEGELERYINPSLTTLEELENQQYLILQSEPGMGKSYEIYKEFLRIKDRTEFHPSINCLLFDMAQYSDETHLVKDIFQNLTLLNWITNKSLLYLFLDSIDECQLQINTLSNIIISKFQQLPLERLYLRIVSRSNNALFDMESEIRKKWQCEIFNYKLAPLRYIDIKNALNGYKIDSDDFLNELKILKGRHFADKPSILFFLIQIKMGSGVFPQSSIDLYRRVLTCLCDEMNPFRKFKNSTNTTKYKDSFAISSTIAFQTALTGKQYITLNNTYIEREDALTFSDILESINSNDKNTYHYTIDNIINTLQTPLFLPIQKQLITWSKKTYQEFLTANYLDSNKIKLRTINKLLFNRFKIRKMLLPRLEEEATWFASMNNQFRNSFIKNDPIKILDSDLYNISEKQKRKITCKILKKFSKNEYAVNYWEFYPNLRKLYYKGIEKRLKNLITKQHNPLVRKTAIEIIKSCNLYTFKDSLFAIALNPEEQHYRRLDALLAISGMINKDDKDNIILLAECKIGKDPNFELKAVAMEILREKEFISTEMFFRLI